MIRNTNQPGMIRLTVMLVLVVLMTNPALSDDHLTRKRLPAFGLQSGYGFQNGLGVSYHYEVVFLKMKSFHTIYDAGKWSFDLIPQPQVNISRYKVTNNSAKKDHGIEFGVNIGFAFTRYFDAGTTGLYIMAGAGPHYVSGVPERQAPGFIFSDNVALGFTRLLSDRLALDLSAGFRHISNASLKRPNGGVNNLVVMGGVVVQLSIIN